MKIICLIFSLWIAFLSGITPSETPKYLVKDEKATSAIVLQNRPQQVSSEDEAAKAIEQAVSRAIEELQYHLERATGKRLPIVSENESHSIPEDHVRILIGPGSVTENLGLRFDAFDEQTYQISTIDNYLVLAGKSPESIQYAVHRFLDLELGVRWLWPGEVGTYVPQSNNIVLSSDLGIIDHPPLQWRHFYARPPDAMRKEYDLWQSRHMLGGERRYPVSHSFLHWWDEYGEDHPELFAQTRGDFQPTMRDGEVRGHRFKHCVTEEKVDEFIIKEWKAAGSPDYWDIANNDGPGQHCLCDRCLATDYPQGQSMEDIWYGARYHDTEANMTVRYVTFWKRVLEKMRAINPDVKLGAYAFSDYRYAPPPGTDLEGMVISVVGAYWEYDDWLAWYETGAELKMRPNWWHTGVVAPHLPLHSQGDFLKFAMEHELIAIRIGSLKGYWGAQGPLYYLIARLSYHPNRSVDEIISEFTDAFGTAKPVIDEYLAYWEDLTDRARYGIRAGIIHPEPGLYETLAIKHDLDEFKGSARQTFWRILPYLYTEDVVNKGYEILDRADAMAADDRGYVKERIQFLRDGLRYLEVTREVFRLGYPGTRPDNSAETWKKYVLAVETLHNIDQEGISSPHVVWSTTEFYNRRDMRAWRDFWNREPGEPWDQYVERIRNMDLPFD